MVRLKSWTFYYRIHPLFHKLLAIYSCFIVSLDITILLLMSLLKIRSLLIKCPTKRIFSLLMLLFFKRLRLSSLWESWISLPIDILIHFDNLPKVFKMPDWQRIMMESKNHWKSLMNAYKNIFQFWCPKPRYTGISKTIQLLKSSSGKALNFAQITRLGNSM